VASPSDLPAAMLRALQGIADGSGRTIVISGPEASGKSALLEAFIDRLGVAGVTVRSLQATYSERTSPYAAVRSLGSAAPADDASDEEGPPGGPFAYLPPDAAPSRRGRGERQRGRVLGVAYAARSRGVERLDEEEYWSGVCAGLVAGEPARLAITVEDGIYADDASRAFLLYLSARTRLRPVVLAIVLDSSDPGFAVWEEQLLGRPEVDWVRTTGSRIDPREANRVKRAVDALRPATRRVLFLTALLGGSVSEVQLARVSRLTFQELADALLPASEGHLVRVEGGRVLIPHPAWIGFLPELMPPDEVRRMHREVADALEAMHPDPTLTLRRQLADHQYAAEPGPVALRYLLECAELSEQLFAFDTVDDLLQRALRCVPSLPVPDRTAAEAELRLFRARCLLLAGRAGEGERELTEGVELALQGRVEPVRVEEWLEPMIPSLQAVGPRPSLLTTAVEIVERLHDRGMGPAEAMLELILAEAELTRGRPEKGRHESHRAGYLARRQPTGPLAALALLAVGHSRSLGPPQDRELAERFLRSAGLSFTSLRRPELEQMAVEYRSRLLEAEGKREEALAIHARAIPILARLRLPSLEAHHQLGVAEAMFDEPSDARGLRALKRAHELVDLIHLTPPAPDLLRVWLLEGRRAGYADDPTMAREYWAAIADRVGPPVLERRRSEAVLRLAALELLHGRTDLARRRYEDRAVADLFGGEVPEWTDWSRRLRQLGPGAYSGAARLALLLDPPGTP
jgi:AAA ATPase domain